MSADFADAALMRLFDTLDLKVKGISTKEFMAEYCQCSDAPGADVGKKHQAEIFQGNPLVSGIHPAFWSC